MEYPARARLEQWPISGDNQYRLKLNFRSVSIDDKGQITVWMAKDEVEQLESDCYVALRESDEQENHTPHGLNFGQEL